MEWDLARNAARGDPDSRKAKHAQWIADLRAEGVIKSKEPAKPEPKEDPPYAIPARLLWVQTAFAALSRCRLVNETGPQPITFADVKAYCELTLLDDEEGRRDLIHFITELDIIYLRHVHGQIRKGREEAQRKAKQDAEKNRGRRR